MNNPVSQEVAELIERLRETRLIDVTEQPAITIVAQDGSETQCGPTKIETRQIFNRDGEEAARMIERLSRPITTDTQSRGLVELANHVRKVVEQLANTPMHLSLGNWSDCATVLLTAADTLEALRTSSGEATEPSAALSDEMIEAACEAHYGKRRARASGGARGITMTVDGQDFSFRDMMQRIWPVLCRAALSASIPTTAPKGDGLKRFADDVQDVQSRIILVHQLRASADIQDEAMQSSPATSWATTSDRAMRMREAADTIERLAAIIAALTTTAQGEVVQAVAWTEPAKGNGKTEFYDHCYGKTVLGSFKIEWKSWKDYPGYAVEFIPEDVGYIGSYSDLTEAKAACAEWLTHRLAFSHSGEVDEGDLLRVLARCARYLEDLANDDLMLHVIVNADMEVAKGIQADARQQLSYIQEVSYQRRNQPSGEVERLREALKPFAQAADGCIDDNAPGHFNTWEHPVGINVTIDDYRRARAALSTPEAVSQTTEGEHHV